LEAGTLATLGGVLSSTAPLPERVWSMLAARHGVVPVEVFGSSETGGIARRQRTQVDETAWTALRDVQVQADDDGQLLVTSPFVGTEMQQPVRTGDAVELLGPGRFVHAGRSDGIVKTAGQRVALQAIEDKLLGIPGVRDAAVLAHRSAQRLRDVELVAVVVAPGLGAKTLREALTAWFEPSTLPRRYHFVDALPRTATGKLPRAQLAQWLEDRLYPKQLQVLAREVLATDPAGAPLAARFQLRVPEEFVYLRGHFPGLPIVPGVAELQCVVVPAVAELRPQWRGLRRVSKLKFRRVIQPNEHLTLELKLGDLTADFELILRGEACASGRLHWEAG
ncbi:MAG: acyl-CoA synthetase, partial [Deltaproteobacteria bacterium]|nr:acyl-CoA synthetase [Deltaproteobacteria bacterium]